MNLDSLQKTQWVYSAQSENISNKHSIRADGINCWCKLARLFSNENICMRPNHAGESWPVVRFEETIPENGYDSLSIILASKDELAAGVKVLGRLLDEDGQPIDCRMVELCGNQETSLRLNIPAGMKSIRLELSVGCLTQVPANHFAEVKVKDCIVYTDDPLTRLANLYGSNKGVACGVQGKQPRCYTVLYNELFRPVRFEKINFLEIGLQETKEHSGKAEDAPSLRMWRDYFPNAKLFGFDTNDFSFFKQKDTQILQDLKSLSRSAGKDGFSVILDNGTQQAAHQQETMGTLFPALKPGGIYIIENVSSQSQGKNTTADLFREFLTTGKIKPAGMSKKQADYVTDNIESAVLIKPNDREVLIVRKKEQS